MHYFGNSRHTQLRITSSNCIGGKELSYVYIKPDTMARAMTFGKGLPESEAKVRLYTDQNEVVY